MKALLTDADRFPFSEDEVADLSRAGITLIQLDGHDEAAIKKASESVNAIFVYSANINQSIIGHLTQCRILARCGTGYDKIDLNAAEVAGICVTYVPEYGSADVAEHTLALILAAARRLVLSDRSTQRGEWLSYSHFGSMHRLSEQTLGIVGFGHIGREVARLSLAVGLKVIVHDPMISTIGIDSVAFANLDELLRCSDIVSLHLPLNASTYKLLDSSNLLKMKKGAILVNTSRGQIVDQSALVDALIGEHLGGAALDVLETEPMPLDDPLRKMDNVLVTPHSGAFTEEGLAELRQTAIIDVIRVLNGLPPIYPVQKELPRAQ